MSSDFLFTKQSFFRGVGSIGNLGGSVLSNSSTNEMEADRRAILSDWQMVGKDIQGAINEYAQAITQ